MPVWVHHALPDIIGVKLTPFMSSLVVLTLQTSGYLAEKYRGGIQGFDPGQTEAAGSLGLGGRRVMSLYRLNIQPTSGVGGSSVQAE